MAVRAVQFLAIVVCALALVPAGAHLAALPNKIHLAQDDYFTVQAIYAGWWLLGLLWPAAIVLNGLAAYLVRDQRRACRLAIVAATGFVSMLVVFILWTLPANQSTQNWTRVTPDWETLRRHWEYSHAANTVIAFFALCCSVASALAWRPPAPVR